MVIDKEKLIALIFGVFIMSILFGCLIFAWQEPNFPPPQGNVPAPLNVSLNPQAKEGSLLIATNPSILTATNTAGLIVQYGNVGIGTTTPVAKLTIDAGSGGGAGNELQICKNDVCCPIWKDCDGDGKTYGYGDCDESDPNSYVGSTAYTTSSGGKDLNCSGRIEEYPIYYLYITNANYMGNLGGRSGADNYCNNDSNKPTDCDGNAWAFISVDKWDEIRNMPNTKGVDRGGVWFWNNGGTKKKAADSWNDLLDGTIYSPAQDVGYSAVYWTGSNPDGSVNSNNCDHWLMFLPGTHYGVAGISWWRDSSWLSYSTYDCNYYLKLLCACKSMSYVYR